MPFFLVIYELFYRLLELAAFNNGLNKRNSAENEVQQQKSQIEQKKDCFYGQISFKHILLLKNGQKKTTVRVHRGSVDVMNYGVQQ